jgi:hypothetical protein
MLYYPAIETLSPAQFSQLRLVLFACTPHESTLSCRRNKRRWFYPDVDNPECPLLLRKTLHHPHSAKVLA